MGESHNHYLIHYSLYILGNHFRFVVSVLHIILSDVFLIKLENIFLEFFLLNHHSWFFPYMKKYDRKVFLHLMLSNRNMISFVIHIMKTVEWYIHVFYKTWILKTIVIEQYKQRNYISNDIKFRYILMLL